MGKSTAMWANCTSCCVTTTPQRDTLSYNTRTVEQNWLTRGKTMRVGMVAVATIRRIADLNSCRNRCRTSFSQESGTWTPWTRTLPWRNTLKHWLHSFSSCKTCRLSLSWCFLCHHLRNNSSIRDLCAGVPTLTIRTLVLTANAR